MFHLWLRLLFLCLSFIDSFGSWKFLLTAWKEPDSKNEIRAGTIPENAASQRVLEKAGFQKGALARVWKMTDPKSGKTWDQDVQWYYLYRPKDS
jgi:RimJ/RimL family protein N-acetyltransferase